MDNTSAVTDEDRNIDLKLAATIVADYATQDGEVAGKAFVWEYGIGKNPKIDALILEGLETNVSLVIQRLPWTNAVPQTVIETAIVFLHIPHTNEVVDDLIWTYLAAYDKSSRQVIRDSLKKGMINNVR